METKFRENVKSINDASLLLAMYGYHVKVTHSLESHTSEITVFYHDKKKKEKIFNFLLCFANKEDKITNQKFDKDETSETFYTITLSKEF